MIAEVNATHKVAEVFVNLAKSITGRGVAKAPKRDLLSPLLAKLRGKAS
jgi:pilus assembly protein CpaE